MKKSKASKIKRGLGVVSLQKSRYIFVSSFFNEDGTMDLHRYNRKFGGKQIDHLKNCISLINTAMAIQLDLKEVGVQVNKIIRFDLIEPDEHDLYLTICSPVLDLYVPDWEEQVAKAKEEREKQEAEIDDHLNNLNENPEIEKTELEQKD